MNAPEMLCEAGVYYCRPRRETDTPPLGYVEYHYRRWRDKQDCGVERIFIQSMHPHALFVLLERWTRMGMNQPGSAYSYTAEL